MCVVGAGIGGIGAALRLQEKGHEVTVYERNDRVGGKCYTRSLDLNAGAVSCDLGAAVVAVNYRHVLYLARRLGEPTRRARAYQVLPPEGPRCSLRDYYLSKSNPLEITLQLAQYLRLSRQFHRRYVSEVGYRDTIPEEFRVSFLQYCERHQLGDLARWFELPLCAWGYGSPEDLPAWYVFGMIGPVSMIGLLVTMLLGRSAFVGEMSNGYGTLVSRLAVDKRLEVKTGAEVRAIVREADAIVIETWSGTESFDSVVIGSPAAAILLSNPTDEERFFLNDLRYAPLSVVLCSLSKDLGAKVLVAPNLRKKNAVKLISTRTSARNVAVCYASIDATMSAGDVEAFVVNDLAGLGIRVTQVHDVQLWKDYFPHFATYAGYQALLHAQGRNRTLYAGSINRFEFVEASLASSVALIDRYFADRRRPPRERFTGFRNMLHMLRSHGAGS
ncbi:MAG: FAD-dependent oxidoreductase [Pseudomonadota bacterium]